MPIINPASTVLVVKEKPGEEIQILLLKRNKKLAFVPGYWVFPGGRIDASDGSLEISHLEETAKAAATREAYEEAGLSLNSTQLEHFCHWTTPIGGSRRFSTWFFHSPLPDLDQDVLIDKSEIVDHIWVHPQEALEQMTLGKLNLLPPTFMTLNRIKQARSYMDVQLEFIRTGVIRAAPVTISENGMFYCLYEGDSGYSSSDVNMTKARHRLIIDHRNSSFRFEYKGCKKYPPVNGGVLF